jgi:4-hydroxyphenylacetate 3-hydroxylase N terminal
MSPACDMIPSSAALDHKKFDERKRGTTGRRPMTAALRTVEPAHATLPCTGAEYLESLKDGREIYIYGERVKDVTTHPAFRNSARMVVRSAARPQA